MTNLKPCPICGGDAAMTLSGRARCLDIECVGWYPTKLEVWQSGDLREFARYLRKLETTLPREYKAKWSDEILKWADHLESAAEPTAQPNETVAEIVREMRRVLRKPMGAPREKIRDWATRLESAAAAEQAAVEKVPVRIVGASPVEHARLREELHEHTRQAKNNLDRYEQEKAVSDTLRVQLQVAQQERDMYRDCAKKVAADRLRNALFAAQERAKERVPAHVWVEAGPHIKPEDVTVFASNWEALRLKGCSRGFLSAVHGTPPNLDCEECEETMQAMRDKVADLERALSLAQQREQDVWDRFDAATKHPRTCDHCGTDLGLHPGTRNIAGKTFCSHMCLFEHGKIKSPGRKSAGSAMRKSGPKGG